MTFFSVIISDYGLQKKLHTCYPGKVEEKIETHRTKEKIRFEGSDPQSIERKVRQLLANKISGNLTGVWLLIPEYLRLGTWELLKSWTRVADNTVKIVKISVCPKDIPQTFILKPIP